MVFRTEIDVPTKPIVDIRHDEGIVMLGSCFTDHVGAMLERDGFDVTYNPMGPLYNVASIHNAIDLSMRDESMREYILRADDNGYWHCLNFASRYVNSDKNQLITTTTDEINCLVERIGKAKTVIITLGTSYVFRLNDGPIVGNCHKFKNTDFTRSRLSIVETVKYLRDIISMLNHVNNIIFTVSPIRHVADGLHGNQLSKSILQLAISEVTDNRRIHYFPAYEIMMDDLRDYRFYAADMKHPSTVAVDYIYDIFRKYYFTKETMEIALISRKEYLKSAHRQIIK